MNRRQSQNTAGQIEDRRSEKQANKRDGVRRKRKQKEERNREIKKSETKVEEQQSQR